MNSSDGPALRVGYTPKKRTAEYQAQRILFVAPSNYGKSRLIAHWAIAQLEAKHIHPSRVVIFSPTHRSDPSQQLLIQWCERRCPGFQEANCYSSVDEAVLLHIYSVQQKLKDDGFPLQHYLVITDDSLSDDALTRKKGALSLVATTGRHYNISTVLSVQAYRSSMNSVVRSQMSMIFIGRLLSIGEVEDLAEQYNQGLGATSREAKKHFIELWEQAIQMHDGHGFLVIHTYIQYGQGRIQLGDHEGPFVDDHQGS